MDPKNTAQPAQAPAAPAQPTSPTTPETPPASPQTPSPVTQPAATSPASEPVPTQPTPTPPPTTPTADTTAPPPPTNPATPDSASSPTPPPPAKKSKILPLAIITVLVLLIGGLLFYIMSIGQDTVAPQEAPQPTRSVPTPTATATPTPEAMDLMASPSANSNRFTSETFGIMFDYAKIADKTAGAQKAVKTYTAGKRVYVYIEGTAPTKGQYVDVLAKLSTDTTLQAVTKITQSDPNFKNCSLETTKQTNYPPTYEMITPVCTGPGGGIMFFLGDTKHPASLLYFSIGQYGIQAETGSTQKMWQDTVRFTSTTTPTAQP